MSTDAADPLVIIGAGQAGLSVATALRAGGYDGDLTLIGAEPHRPYERPALSKTVLSKAVLAPDHDGGAPASSYAEPPCLADPAQWRALALDARLGCRVRAIDRANRHLRCDDGSVVPYDTLFLATGGRARRLPGLDGERVHYLRDLDDARRLRQALTTARHLLVVGGGWIGLEVAATARQAGLAVTVLEAGSRLCERALPADAAARLLEYHRQRGVVFHFGVTARPRADTSGVYCELNGRTLSADHLLVGIGLVPETQLAAEAGLAVDDGVLVDAVGRTEDHRIFAVGDVARFPSHFSGAIQRLESWTHARLQAEVAAAAALGGNTGYRDLPWFWSDQFDLNVQVVGAPIGEGVGRDYGDGRRTLFYFLDGALRGAVAFNAGRDIGFVRRWLNAGRAPPPTALADPSRDLAALHRALRETGDVH